MDEKKFVTLEMFEKYHEQLMKHITGSDGLTLESETCPKCGATITSDKCDKCNAEKEEE